MNHASNLAIPNIQVPSPLFPGSSIFFFHCPFPLRADHGAAHILIGDMLPNSGSFSGARRGSCSGVLVTSLGTAGAVCACP